MSASIDEARIAAFLEGRLTGAEADAAAALLESDPQARAIAERLAPGAGTDALLLEAFGAPMAEPVPAALRAAAAGGGGKVVTMRPRRAWAPAALAASLALTVGLGAGFSLRPAGAPTATQTEAAAGSEIGAQAIALGALGGAAAAALTELPAGAEGGGLRPLATFRDGGGASCREFETVGDGGAATAAGVACLRDGSWRVLALAAAFPAPHAGPADGYAPAGGAPADSLDAVLDALAAGPALPPAEEAALIARGWR